MRKAFPLHGRLRCFRAGLHHQEYGLFSNNQRDPATCSPKAADRSIGTDRLDALPQFRTVNNENTEHMKTKRTRSIEPEVVIIGQVCFLLLTIIVVPF